MLKYSTTNTNYEDYETELEEINMTETAATPKALYWALANQRAGTSLEPREFERGAAPSGWIRDDILKRNLRDDPEFKHKFSKDELKLIEAGPKPQGKESEGYELMLVELPDGKKVWSWGKISSYEDHKEVALLLS